MKHDLHMWLTFFSKYNGVSVFHDRFWVSSEDCQLYTDSAAGPGFGSVVRTQVYTDSAAGPGFGSVVRTVNFTQIVQQVQVLGQL